MSSLDDFTEEEETVFVSRVTIRFLFWKHWNSDTASVHWSVGLSQL
jgi:hypothetical protein